MAEISEEALPKTLRAMSPKEANLILVAGGAWLLTGLFKRSSLIDPIPWPVTYLAALARFGLGAWISWRILKRSTEKLDRRSIIAIITLPLFSLFFATFLARTAYEGLKYGGAQTATALAEAKVISKDTKWNRRAFVTFGPIRGTYRYGSTLKYIRTLNRGGSRAVTACSWKSKQAARE